MRSKARPAGRRRLRLDALEARDVPAAIHIDFVADAAQSSLTLSGNVAGVNIQTQGAGSLTSAYSGTLAADVDFDANTIDLTTAGTSLDATVTGNWRPNVGGGSGTAPADYGGKAHLVIIPFILEGDVFVAIRNAVASLNTGGAVALSGTGGTRTFASTQSLTLTGGAADYDASSLGQGGGSESLAGSSGTNASGTASSIADQGGGVYRLSVPVDLTINTEFSGQTATLRMVGQMVGFGSIPLLDLNGPGAGNDATATYTEDAPPAPIVAADMTATWAAGGNLTGATIAIANPLDGAAELLDVNVGASGLIKSYTNGQLTLSGTASLGVYQAVLRTVTYVNTSQSPNPTARQVKFSISAGATGSFSQTSVVSVTPVEDPVTIDPIADQTVDEGATLNLTATAQDPDLPATIPTFSLDAPPANASITADGQFTFTPDDSQGGQTFAITVRATDLGGTFATTTFRVTVQDVNAAPVLPNLADQNVDEGSPLSFLVGASDVDLPADTLTYALVNPPAGAQVDPVTGLFSWAAADGPLTTSITVTVTDNGSPQLSDTQTFQINVLNVAPTATFDAGGSVVEGRPALISFTNPFDPSATDAAAGFRYSYDFNNDGDFTDPGELADSTDPTLSAVFQADGVRTIRGRIADKDGAVTDYVQTLTVTNVDIIVASFDRGGPSTVRVLDANTLAPRFASILAYDKRFRGGVQTAIGDWTGDGVPDIITAPGPGGGPLRQTNHLKVFDGVTGTQVTAAFASPTPFGEKFGRGYNLAAGDFTGDGTVDLAVAPRGGLPTVVVIDGATRTAQPALTVLPTTLPYRTGVRVAAGDVDGDGRPELIVTGGARLKSLVRVLDPITGLSIRPDFNPFADLLFVRGGSMWPPAT